ncbi:hypothetical protein [uncultured Desulfobacter sp.]|uniref:hypothetical protein n=1 Tax=uncultured Desulfobacter sp. TaxID=240139 RepID=UPI002AAB023D|nr:hypothetical protein [uncultured Desulfobacter sp.]
MPIFVKRSFLTALLLISATGCTRSNQMTTDNIYRAIYDMSTQEQALKEGYPSGGPDPDIPSYEEYKFDLQDKGKDR